MEANQHLLLQLRQRQQPSIQVLPQPQLQHPQLQLLPRVVTPSAVTPQVSNRIPAIVTATSCVRIWAWASGRSSTSTVAPGWLLIRISRPVIGQKMSQAVKTKRSTNIIQILDKYRYMINTILMFSFSYISRNQRLQFSPEKDCLSVRTLVSSPKVRHPIILKFVFDLQFSF